MEINPHNRMITGKFNCSLSLPEALAVSSWVTGTCGPICHLSPTGTDLTPMT